MRKWECTVCGYIHEGEEPPDECPVCAADKSLFVEIIEEAAATSEPTGAAAADSPSQTTAKPTFIATVYKIVSEQILKHHLHPIAVHTPNGILPMALIFLLITAFFGFPLFETAALYSFVFVLITMPIVVFTGYEVWQKRYRGAMTTTFKIKIGASIVTITLLCVLSVWRMIHPDIITTASTGRWIYLLLSLVLVVAVGLAGHVGGTLVFGSRKN